MCRFFILSFIICIQLISIVSSDTSDASPNSHLNVLIPTPAELNTKDFLESDEEIIYAPRSTSFLRFGKQSPSASGQFLRFGRSPSPFLRFGRTGQNGGTFLRFGRQVQQPSSNNFLRFGKKAEFLRFG